MKEGDIVLIYILHADGSTILRPVLLSKPLRGYNDSLVCGISTHLHQLIQNFDELIDEKSNLFAETGLRQSSIIRLDFLAVVPVNKIPGSIGRISPELHKRLLERLAKYLMQ